jgi:hypothetical protein
VQSSIALALKIGAETLLDVDRAISIGKTRSAKRELAVRSRSRRCPPLLVRGLLAFSAGEEEQASHCLVLADAIEPPVRIDATVAT